MNLFLKEFSESRGEKESLIVMDGAGWHKSRDLEVPKNIKIILLPPYSPELNPVERFWQHIKETILKNRLFETIDQLEEKICSFFEKIKRSDVKEICKLNYLSEYL